MKNSKLIYITLIIIYVILFFIQINQPPFERFPAYDTFWGNVLQAGKLHALKLSLLNGEFPTINPYVGFGWNNIGDTTLPQSFLFPLNFLILIFPPDVVIIIRTLILLMLGGIGTFLYINSLTKDHFLSFLAGLTYISIPFVISMNFYYSILNTFCLIPLFLLLIHEILEKDTIKKTLLFIGLSIFAISSGDVFIFIILPVVVGVYSLFIALGYYKIDLFNSLKKAFKLVFLFCLASSFYLIPLYNNLSAISMFGKSLQEAGFSLPSVSIGVKGFLKFFYENGFQSLYKPIEGSGLLLYVPVFFYFVIIFSLIFKRLVFRKSPKQAFIPFTLILIGLVMFIITVVYYSFSSISKAGKGVLRYHLNILPFVIVLTGFICLSSIIKLSKKKKIIIFAAIFLFAFVIDLTLFVLPYPYQESNLFFVRHEFWSGSLRSTNLVPVYLHRFLGRLFMYDLWPLLPMLNLLFIVLFSLYAFHKNSYKAKKSVSAVFIVSAMILPLLTISIHNDLRLQQNRWQIVFRDPYRWNSYLERKKCIDNIIDRYDINYRTLYVGKDRTSSWSLIAETELNIKEREKVLFSYKETMHPYTGLLFSTLNGYKRLSNLLLTSSNKLPKSIELIKLMGVKYVISAHEKIDSPFLHYRGECITEDSLFEYIHGYPLGGSIYIYELRDPLRIAFLVDNYKNINLHKTLNTIWENKEHPWINNEVYLEEDAKSKNKLIKNDSRKSSSSIESKASIERETFNKIQLNISTPKEKFLVLSYIYRPNWKAHIGSTQLKIYRAYGGFMCIKVPPGNNTVKLKYTSVDLYLGLVLTFFTFLIPFIPHLFGFLRQKIHKKLEVLK